MTLMDRSYCFERAKPEGQILIYTEHTGDERGNRSLTINQSETTGKQIHAGKSKHIYTVIEERTNAVKSSDESEVDPIGVCVTMYEKSNEKDIKSTKVHEYGLAVVVRRLPRARRMFR